MSDFYISRLAATYTPTPRSFGLSRRSNAETEGESPRHSGINSLDAAEAGQTAHLQEVALIRHGHLLAEPARQEWSLQTASYEYIAHEWAGDLPTGNARLTLAAQPLVRANTRAALERKLRHLELLLNLHRTGTLLLEEAYSNGAPTLHTYWHAVIETANASPLPLEEAPPIPGAWGKLELSIILTNPSEDNPLSRRIEEEPDGSEEQDPQPQYATGWIDFIAACDKDTYINIGETTITAGNYALTPEQWANLINAANCGVTATPDSNNDDNLYRVNLTATAPGTQGCLSLSTTCSEHILLSGPTLTLPGGP